MSDKYDGQGNPITDLLEWVRLFEDREYQRVAKDEVGDARVSTVWLGINHSFGSGPPLIFETMIFGGDYDNEQWRYSTEEEAQAGHDRVVTALRNGEPVRAQDTETK